ncbi:MAG: transglutaminase domain-containing protein [Propionibacteriaceae bacterium]|jgi:transglutaminase-like putative cysteine protease|nr:transglutaminase domain-containing protein [Propionibacteriaceae bacterium]
MTAKSILTSAPHVVLAAVLATLAMVPLAPVFDDPRYWLAVGGGVLVGGAVAVLGARVRAGSLLTFGFGLLGYLAFGAAFAVRESAIAGFMPSLATLRDLVLNVVFGWKQLLTVSVPLNGADHLFGMPYLIALIATAVSVSLALRTASAGLPLLPLAAQLVTAIAFGEVHGMLPAVVGAVFGALALGWAAWRRSARRSAEKLALGDEARRLALQTSVLGVAMLLVCGVAGAAASAALGANADRFVLREQVVPPLDPHDFASPLMSFRKYVEDGDQSKETLFRVSGLPQGATIRLATLDLYDGIVYQVSGSGGPGSGVFQRAGRNLPGSDVGDPATVQVTIDALRGVWVPDTGYLTGVEYAGPRAAALRSGLHYNAATATALQTAGVQSGDVYTFTTDVAARPTDDQLDKATIAAVTVPAPTLTPDAIQTILDEALPDVAPPSVQVRRIEKYLNDKGFFSNGQGPDAVPSLPGHNYRRLSEMLDKQQLIGDDEQYAVVMALMLAKIGVPARVVMGFRPSSTGTEIAVTGKDVRAWVEVPFDGLGWVSFFPRPDNKPDKQTPQTRERPRPQVPQPPLPPQQPAELPPQPPDAQAGDENRGADLAWLWAALRIGGITLAVLAVVVGPGLVMLAAKSRRRTRRRNADRLPDRVSGGWDEIVDSAVDSGARLTPAATRREHAVELRARYPELDLQQLGARADHAVFAAGEPTAAEVAAYWDDVDSVRVRIGKQTPFLQRVHRFFAPRSVLSRRPRWWRGR